MQSPNQNQSAIPGSADAQQADQMSPKAFAESMKQKTQTFLEEVMKAVNEAPDGEWIEGSEEGVRDLSAEFRKAVFQAAVQGRVDAAEAAFSPSTGDSDRSGHAATGHEESAE